MKRLGIVVLVLVSIVALLIYVNNRTKGELMGRCIIWLWKAGENAKRDLPPHDDRLLHRTRGDSNRVDGIAFSPDGKWVFTCGSDGLKQWDAYSYKLEHFQTFDLAGWGWPNPVYSIAVDRSKPLVYFGTTVRDVQVWNYEERKIVGTIATRERWIENVIALAISPDGSTLAIAENNGKTKGAPTVKEDFTILLWDLGESTEKRRLVGLGQPTNSLVFLPDGKTLMSNSVGSVVFWDTFNGQSKIRHGPDKLNGPEISLDPNQNFAIFEATLNYDFKGMVLSDHPRRGFLIEWMVRQGLVKKGQFVLSGGLLFDGGTGNATKRLVQFGNGMEITTSTISPDHRVVVTGGDGHAMRGGFGNNDDQRDRNLCWWRIEK